MAGTAGKLKPFPPASTWREALLLVGVAFVLALMSWAVRTPRLPLRADTSLYELDLGAPIVSPEIAVAFYEAGTHVFVDIRPDAEISATIPGAFFIREATFDDDLREVFDFLMPEDPLILYGDGNLRLMGPVVARLGERGYTAVQILQGDVDSWHAAGGATSPAPVGDPDEGAAP